METDPRLLICELGRAFYALGWASGTGGGICIREGDRVLVAPSGVQKERMTGEQLFVLDLDGGVVAGPDDSELRPSECSSLFLKAITLRGAGAVIHSHSIHAVLATLVFQAEFAVSHLGGAVAPSATRDMPYAPLSRNRLNVFPCFSEASRKSMTRAWAESVAGT